MLHRLPAELMWEITALLDEKSLCALSESTRSQPLNAISLRTLFKRYQTRLIIPPSSRSFPKPQVGIILPKDGVCITLCMPGDSIILRAMRRALPAAFEDAPVTAICCTFTGSLRCILRSMQSLGQFLFFHPNALGIEAICLNFRPATWSPPRQNLAEVGVNPTNHQFVQRFFSSFTAKSRKLRRCASLVIIGDQMFDAYFSIYRSETPWFLGGSRETNLALRVGSWFRQKGLALFKGPSSESDQGLLELCVDSPTTLKYLFPQAAKSGKSIRRLAFGSYIEKWDNILSLLTLPNLETLTLPYYEVSMDRFSSFLSRHPKITSLHISPPWVISIKSLPLSLLPNLTTLILSPFSLAQLPTLQPRIDLPNLKSIILPVFQWGGTSILNELQAFDIRHIVERLDNPPVTLKLVVKVTLLGTAYSRWLLNMPPETGSDALRRKVSVIGVHVFKVYYLLNWGNNLSFAKWLRAFPALEVVELSHISADDKIDASKPVCWSPALYKLCRGIKDENPKVKTLSVDGIPVLCD